MRKLIFNQVGFLRDCVSISTIGLIWVFLLVFFIAPQIHAQTLVAPTGLTAEVDASGVTLSWTAPSDASEIIAYDVYRCTLPCMDSDLGYYAPVSGSLGNVPTTFLDTAVSAGVSYRYAVVAYYNTLNNESDKSSSITFTTADTTAPTLSSATVDGTALVITFNETLAAAASLANSAFAVKKTPSGGSEEAASLSGSPSISGATVTLTLAAAVVHTDAGVKVSYTKPGTGSNNKLQDAAANEVADFADQAVTNNTVAPDTTAPTLSSATVDGTALVITFNETLAPAADLDNSAFAVKKTPSQGSEQTQSLSGSPSISGATVTLTLAAAAAHDDTGVKVSYTKPTSGSNNKLQDAAANEVASFADQAVTNNTAQAFPAPTGLMADAGASGITDSDSPEIIAYIVFREANGAQGITRQCANHIPRH